MVAAAGADHLEYLVVAVLDTAVHDADRLFPQDSLVAVAELTGRRECYDLIRRPDQPQVTTIARLRYRDSGRSATCRRVKEAGTAHLTHHQEVGPVTTGSGAATVLSHDGKHGSGPAAVRTSSEPAGGELRDFRPPRPRPLANLVTDGVPGRGKDGHGAT